MQSGGISVCSCEVLYRGALGLEYLTGMPWSKNALPRAMQGVRGQGRGACRRNHTLRHRPWSMCSHMDCAAIRAQGGGYRSAARQVLHMLGGVDAARFGECRDTLEL
jgi:hypothetical protein